MQNYELLGPHAAWTGPLSRGDFSTIALHRRALAGYPVEFQQAYDAMTRLAARVLSRSPEELLTRLAEAMPAVNEPDPVVNSRTNAVAAARPAS